MRSILLLSVLLVLAGLSFSIDVGSCAVITSPGTYVLNQSVSGAPNNVDTSFQVDLSCIVINSSSVTFDCNGFSITRPSAPGIGTDYAGILVNTNPSNTLTGITIQNCPNVQNYTFHILARNITSSTIQNNTVFGTYPNYGIRCDDDCTNLLIQNNTVSSGYGGILVLFGGTNNRINNNRVLNNDVVGIEIQSTNTNVTNNAVSGAGTFFTYWHDDEATNARFENNNATDVGIGYYIQGDNSVFINNRASNNAGFSGTGFDIGGSGNTIIQSVAFNNSAEGFSVSGSDNNLTNNTAALNGDDGFIVSSDGNFLSLNIANGNGLTGFHVSGASFNVLDRNTAYLNGEEGFHLDDSFVIGPPESSNNLTDNRAYNNSGNGFRLTATDNNILEGNNATDNGLSGFLLEGGMSGFSFVGSNSNLLLDNRGTGNGLHGLFIDNSVDNVVDPSVFCDNTQYGVFLNNSNSTTINDTVACDQPFLSGIKLLNSSDNELNNNEAYGNGDSGIDLEFSDSNELDDNVAHDNTDQGFHFDESDFNLIDGNTAYGNPRGFEVREAAFNNFTGNEAFNNTQDGFALLFLDSNNNLFTGNTAHDNAEAGFAAGEGPHDNSFMENDAYNNLFGFYLTNFANNNYLFDNTGDNNSFDGFRVENSETNTLDFNEASGNGDDGFIVVAFAMGTDNTLTNNVAHDNSNDGFEIDSDVNNTLANNTAYNNFRGFHLFATSGNVLGGNWAYDNSDDGFSLEGSDDNVLDSNIAENNSGAGISIVGSFDATNNTLTGNTACGNDLGIFILFDYENTLSGNTVCDNADTGVWVELATGNSMSGDHLYGNGRDFYISTDSSTPTDISMSGVVFDRDAGDFTNYTNISLSDDLEFGENTAYSMDHSAQPAPLPTPEHSSFAGKFVNITDLSLADHGIDSITWHWLEGELGGYTESSFLLMKHNGTWFPVNITPNTAANTLSLSNVSAFSVFGILQLTFQEGGDGNPPSGEPECQSDLDCPATEQCMNEECVPVPCDCGVVEEHQCVEYQCCSSADCPAGFSCVSNECVPPEETPEEPEPEQCSPPGCCTSDSQCGASQMCSMPAGSAKGSCQDITACGQIADHKVVELWECDGPNCPACPAGQQCVDHECVAPDLSCPSSGVVGSQTSCLATDCESCPYKVELPNGQTITGVTDPSGNIKLPLNLEGTYKVTLLKDGQPLKTVQIQSLPQSPPEEEEKPTAAGGLEQAVLWLLLIVALGIVAFVYWRSRQGGKGKK